MQWQVVSKLEKPIKKSQTNHQTSLCLTRKSCFSFIIETQWPGMQKKYTKVQRIHLKISKKNEFNFSENKKSTNWKTLN